MGLKETLGFLGLLGILILILIYIIKPNFQQKFISSTYVWKLSLKYKRKKLPVDRIRNLLIFICQILIITSCAFILTQPYVQAKAPQPPEKIAIIDASASMRAIDSSGTTRFKRAVEEVKALGQETLINKQGLITVILAGKEASNVIVRTNALNQLNEALNRIIAGNTACTFGDADIGGAMRLAGNVIGMNPDAEVVYFTATEYTDKGKVDVVDIRNSAEWNAAILSVTPLLDGYDPDGSGEIIRENWCVFEVKVASYNRNSSNLPICFKAEGANGGLSIRAIKYITCFNNETMTVYFDESIFSYKNVEIWIGEAEEGKNYEEEDMPEVMDSFHYDNRFYIYGGEKDTINIQYVSTFSFNHPKVEIRGQPSHNNFVNGILNVLSYDLNSKWNIKITRDIVPGNREFVGGNADFYIFENVMPSELPSDGAVLMINPDIIPKNVDLILEQEKQSFGENGLGISLSTGMSHAITANMDPRNIQVSLYNSVSEKSSTAFESLMFFGEDNGGENENLDRDAALLVRNVIGTDEQHPSQKVAVLPFSLNFSTFVVRPEWSYFMTNLFEYFFPATLTKLVYDVDEKVTVNARGDSVDLTSPSGSIVKYHSFPFEYTPSLPGQYTLKQTLLSDKNTEDKFHVKISEKQSNFAKIEKELINPAYPIKDINNADNNLIIWFALALFTLLLAERSLYAKEKV